METGHDDRYLTLSLGSDVYGIQAQVVREILEVPETTRVPGLQPVIRGVTNLRGVILPVVELRTLVDLEPVAGITRTCLVVVEHRSQLVALAVDAVHEVIRLDPARLWPLESPISKASSTQIAVHAAEDRDPPVQVLHLERIVHLAGLGGTPSIPSGGDARPGAASPGNPGSGISCPG